MSAHTFIPIHVEVKLSTDHKDAPPRTMDSFVGYIDEAVKFFAQGVNQGDRCSPPMSLRRVGAILNTLEG